MGVHGRGETLVKELEYWEHVLEVICCLWSLPVLMLTGNNKLDNCSPSCPFHTLVTMDLFSLLLGISEQ